MFVQDYCDVVVLAQASLKETNWAKTTRKASSNTFRFFAIPFSICRGLLTTWRLGSKEPRNWQTWLMFQRNLPMVSFLFPTCIHPMLFQPTCWIWMVGLVLNHSQHFPRVMILPGPVEAARSSTQRFTTDDFAVPGNRVSSLG